MPCCNCIISYSFGNTIHGYPQKTQTSCGASYTRCCDGCSNCNATQNALENANDNTNNVVNTSFNLSNSTIKMVNNKKERATKGLIQIKDLAYWPISSNYALYFEGQRVYLFTQVTKKELNLLLLKMANWKISQAEKQNLYYNLISQSQTTNNLNLFYQMKNQFVQYGLGQVDSSILNNYIERYLSYVISRILIYAEYGQELENYDYTQLFNLGFQFINLNLSYIRTFLWAFVPGLTLLQFGVDTRKVKPKK